MTSANRSIGQNAATAPLLRPGEVAKILHCSEWWVKEQARKRRIPFTRTGGSYRFTAEHVAEIIQIFEERPSPGATPLAPRRKAPRAGTEQPVTLLRSRPPRRARNAKSQNSAA